MASCLNQLFAFEIIAYVHSNRSLVFMPLDGVATFRLTLR